ncbi:MAG: hypothetical protein JW765_09520 [Deltaproteobacteria bacterium]|nr:hypothetical protein [Candidatus Zymogenaceae bacterium]
MKDIRVGTLLVIIILIVTATGSLSAATKNPTEQFWSTPVFNRVIKSIDGAEGRPFDSIRKILQDRIARAPVFPPATEKIRSDELFLLSPRNTAIRASAWNRTFSWNWADGGRDYILHAYSKDNEVFKRGMGDARRAVVSEHDAPFVPGVVYSWDISLCVERCNLHLSSRAALRPTFVIMSADEEAVVAGDLTAVTAWCESEGISGTEEATAIYALALEAARLYMEETQLLQKEIKKRPNSVLLHLVYSGALSAMNSPYGARDEYEKARALFEKETGGAAEEIPPGGTAGHE